jgi:hypothetical protein
MQDKGDGRRGHVKKVGVRTGSMKRRRENNWGIYQHWDSSMFLIDFCHVIWSLSVSFSVLEAGKEWEEVKGNKEA